MTGVRRGAVLIVLMLAAAFAPVPHEVASSGAGGLGTAAVTPPFQAKVYPIGSTLAQRMRYSYRAGCPVPLRNLRYVRLTVWLFDGTRSVGELVVHYQAVDEILAAFHAAYDQRFRIRRMQLVDNFRGSDDASMAADNTSAFNCRFVAGTTRWSMHAYGLAVDINPVENPSVTGGAVSPPAGRAFVVRRPYRTGMITNGLLGAFTAGGWGWGGSWTSSKDYMHFSSNGR